MWNDPYTYVYWFFKYVLKYINSVIEFTHKMFLIFFQVPRMLQNTVPWIVTNLVHTRLYNLNKRLVQYLVDSCLFQNLIKRLVQELVEHLLEELVSLNGKETEKWHWKNVINENEFQREANINSRSRWCAGNHRLLNLFKR